MKNIDRSDSISPILNKLPNNPQYVMIGFNKRFNKGDNFYQTSSDLVQTEILYTITGLIMRNHPNDYIVILNQLFKEDFTKDTIQLCLQFGCAGFNLEYILRLPSEKAKLPIYLFKNNLNYDILKLFKLKYMKNADYHQKDSFMNDNYINFPIEVKADIDYLNKIQVFEQGLPDYEKLLQDYLKLRGIYKGMYNFNQGNLIKIFSGLENKINLIEIALLKGEILKMQEDMILKKMVKDVREDVKRLKREYLS